MAGTLTTLMPAALAIFTIVLGLFGGLSYGFYNFGATWAGLGFFVGLVGVLMILKSALKSFFGKYSGRILFVLWLVSILGTYFIFLFQKDKYPMGIDLAGGTELIYVLDYSQTDRNIEKTSQALAAAKAKDPGSNEALKLQRDLDDLQVSRKSTPDKAAEVVRKRVDPTGTKGIPVTTLGADKQRLRIQLPKVTTEEVNRIKEAIRTQGHLTFQIVIENEDVIEKTKNSPTKTYVDPDTKIEYSLFEIITKRKFSTKDKVDPIVVKTIPDMVGEHILMAFPHHGHDSQNWEISLRFDPQGSNEFGRLTAANKGKKMAIILDRVARSAPVIKDAILGECLISGNFSQKEAEELAGVLTAGSMPAEVKIESELSVKPSLGLEQITSGMQATVIGSGLVILFMLVYYRMAGAIASFCTLLNIFMLLGAMGFFKATLTLPGIAGIVLTLGMSVDANVLILERLREELQRGRTLKLAVTHGFDRAFLTIIDCNLTTLISGIVLYYLGTGPVRGFAVSLSIGILTTLFCNLWLNWILTEWIVSREVFSNLNMMQFFKTTKINFMSIGRFSIPLSGAAVLASIVLFFSYQDQIYDVDFTGGTLIQFNFADGKSKDQKQVKQIVDEKIKDAMVKMSGKQQEFTTQSYDSPDQDMKNRSFTIVMKSTELRDIEELINQIKIVFAADLEPDAITTNEKAMLIRFNQGKLTGDEAKALLTTALASAVKDPTNAEIKQVLLDLKISNIEPAGANLLAELSPLPADADVRKKILNAVGQLNIPGRADGAISRQRSFGSQVAGEMKWQSLLALVVANIGVFIYIWFRFEFSGSWGFGAIVALVHDVCIAIGGVVLANVLAPTLGISPMLIDLNIVAALLTIIGFSVNDTIVVFDRIREVKAAHPTRNFNDIANEAINATLSRTLLTSLTILLADVSLLIFGGPTIRGMAYTLLIGFIVGVYSSVFIATPVMIWWYGRVGAGNVPALGSSQRSTKIETIPEAQV